VTLSHRDQLGHIQTTPSTLTHQRGGGLLVAVTGGGHRQPQPGTRRGERRRLDRLTGELPSWVVAGPGGLASRGSAVVRQAVLAVMVGWRLDRQMPRQARQGALGGRRGVPPGPRAPGRASVGRQDRASATIARALAR
jgi:hypothetical protein